MATSLLVLLASAVVGGGGDRPKLIKWGGDPGPGLVVNLTAGSRPFDPPDRARPTVVFVHGLNLAPRVVHFGMGEELAAAIARRRGGESPNVLNWNWNARTFTGLSVRSNLDDNVKVGVDLAYRLAALGLSPDRVHLIGHSSGSIVAVSAARTWHGATGVPVAQLTMIDPAAVYHHILFDTLGGGRVSPRVENYWSPGVSGYGRAAAVPGVRDVAVPNPTPWRGAVAVARSGHLEAFRWYLRSVDDASAPAGYNASVFALR